MRQWWESYHSDGDPNFVLANKQQFESIEGGPKEEFGDVRTRKKKKLVRKIQGLNPERKLVFYLLRLDAEEKRKEKNQQNLC